jgi:hypothetical protein
MEKIKSYLPYVSFVLLFFVFIKGCGTSSEVNRLTKELKVTNQKIDSLSIKMRTEIEIGGLKASKRTLYDWNAVVRTTVRPDDRMIQYDEEIKKLENK